MDAITLLKDDHKTVEALFKRFEKAGDRAFVEKREIVDRVIAELSKYAAMPELHVDENASRAKRFGEARNLAGYD